jgi:hypothetical protein
MSKTLKFDLIKESTLMTSIEETIHQSSHSIAYHTNAACFDLQISNVEISPFEIQNIPTNREQ